MNGEITNTYRILVVKYVLYSNHFEERENGKISLTLPRLKLIYVIYIYILHHTAQTIQCASITKTKQVYELGLLTCAGFEEKSIRLSPACRFSTLIFHRLKLSIYTTGFNI